MSFNQQKYEFAQFILPYCPFMQVNVQVPGVVLPEALMRDGLVLRIGRDKHVMAMPDLELTPKGWSATLISLQHGINSYATIPWEAIDRMWIGDPFSGPMLLWPEAIAQALVVTPLEEPAPEAPPKGLRLVKSEDG